MTFTVNFKSHQISNNPISALKGTTKTKSLQRRREGLPRQSQSKGGQRFPTTRADHGWWLFDSSGNGLVVLNKIVLSDTMVNRSESSSPNTSCFYRLWHGSLIALLTKQYIISKCTATISLRRLETCLRQTICQCNYLYFVSRFCYFVVSLVVHSRMLRKMWCQCFTDIPF